MYSLISLKFTMYGSLTLLNIPFFIFYYLGLFGLKPFVKSQEVDSSHFSLIDLDTLVLQLSFNLVILQESLHLYM